MIQRDGPMQHSATRNDSIVVNIVGTLRGGSIYWCLAESLCTPEAVWKEVHHAHQYATSPLPVGGCPVAAGDSPDKWS